MAAGPIRPLGPPGILKRGRIFLNPHAGPASFSGSMAGWLRSKTLVKPLSLQDRMTEGDGRGSCASLNGAAPGSAPGDCALGTVGKEAEEEVAEDRRGDAGATEEVIGRGEAVRFTTEGPFGEDEEEEEEEEGAEGSTPTGPFGEGEEDEEEEEGIEEEVGGGGGDGAAEGVFGRGETAEQDESEREKKVPTAAERDQTGALVEPPAPFLEAVVSILEAGVEEEGGSRETSEEGVVVGALRSLSSRTHRMRDTAMETRGDPSYSGLLSGSGGGDFGPQTRSSARLSSAKKTSVLERAKLRKVSLLEGETPGATPFDRRWNSTKVLKKSALCGVKLSGVEAEELHKFLLRG